MPAAPYDNRSMTLSISRALSLAVVAVAYARAWAIPDGLWIVTLVSVAVLALIWFPQQIDDLTYGSWYRGYQIDSPLMWVARVNDRWNGPGRSAPQIHR